MKCCFDNHLGLLKKTIFPPENSTENNKGVAVFDILIFNFITHPSFSVINLTNLGIVMNAAARFEKLLAWIL